MSSRFARGGIPRHDAVINRYIQRPSFRLHFVCQWGRLNVPDRVLNRGMPKRILLVDDHPEVLTGLATVLSEAGIGTCCGAHNCVEALAIADSEIPDAAVVDLSMGDDDTVALVTELRTRHIPVLVYSMYDRPSHVKRAISAGARGYITKGESRDVVRAVRDVLEGWMLISPRAAEGLDAD